MSSNIFYQTDLIHSPEFAKFCKNLGIGMDLCLKHIDQNYSSDLDIFREVFENIDIPLVAHLPFYGLDLGCPDKYIREYSISSICQAIKVAKRVGASVAVFHSYFTPLIPSTKFTRWYSAFSDSLKKLVTAAEQNEMTIAIENTWEPDTKIFERIFNDFESEYLGFCFDAAHSFVFSKVDFTEWLDAFGDKLKHAHLSDNNLIEDLHQPIGQGKIDFARVFDELRKREITTGFSLEIAQDGVASSVDIIRDLLGESTTEKV